MEPKAIYKKELFVELVRLDNNFLYTMKNPNNPRFQIYYFEHTRKLERDIANLTNPEYVESKAHGNNSE